MSDFKVGDKVYIEGTITNIDDDGTLCTHRVAYSSGDENHHRLCDLIPASRVTIAPARRAAEFPRDWGKPAWFSDHGISWNSFILSGYRPGHEMPWINDRSDGYTFCEVEE